MEVFSQARGGELETFEQGRSLGRMDRTFLAQHGAA